MYIYYFLILHCFLSNQTSSLWQLSTCLVSNSLGVTLLQSPNLLRFPFAKIPEGSLQVNLDHTRKSR